MRSSPAVFDEGMMIVLNPRACASRARTTAWVVARTSPVNPTSPNTAVCESTGTFLKLEAIAATTPKIDRRFVNFQSARNIHKHIVAQQLNARHVFQAWPSKRNAILVHALGHAPARAVFRFRNERLNLDEQWPGAFHAGRNNRTGDVLRPLLQETSAKD